MRVDCNRNQMAGDVAVEENMAEKSTQTCAFLTQTNYIHNIAIMEYVEKAMAFAEEQLKSELATPILVALSTVLFLVIVFYTLSPKSKKTRKARKSSTPGGGSVLVDGVRRSTR